MTWGRALLVAAAAMLATGCGALGFPEARAPLSASAHSECAQQQAAARAAQPSSQAYSALMP
jgi:hypothetical protein